MAGSGRDRGRDRWPSRSPVLPPGLRPGSCQGSRRCLPTVGSRWGVRSPPGASALRTDGVTGCRIGSNLGDPIAAVRAAAMAEQHLARPRQSRSPRQNHGHHDARAEHEEHGRSGEGERADEVPPCGSALDGDADDEGPHGNHHKDHEAEHPDQHAPAARAEPTLELVHDGLRRGRVHAPSIAHQPVDRRIEQRDPATPGIRDAADSAANCSRRLALAGRHRHAGAALRGISVGGRAVQGPRILPQR